jgi:hypothetical protein
MSGFTLAITENHESYDIVIAEFGISPDDAFDIIERYVADPDKRMGFLNTIIMSDNRFESTQKHMKESEELDRTVSDIVNM